MICLKNNYSQIASIAATRVESMRDLLIRSVYICTSHQDHYQDHHHHPHHRHPHHHQHLGHQVGGDVHLWREGHDGLPAPHSVPQVLRHLLCLLIIFWLSWQIGTICFASWYLLIIFWLSLDYLLIISWLSFDCLGRSAKQRFNLFSVFETFPSLTVSCTHTCPPSIHPECYTSWIKFLYFCFFFFCICHFGSWLSVYGWIIDFAMNLGKDDLS